MSEDPNRSHSTADALSEAVRKARLELAELVKLAQRAKILQKRYSTIIPQPEVPGCADRVEESPGDL